MTKPEDTLQNALEVLREQSCLTEDEIRSAVGKQDSEFPGNWLVQVRLRNLWFLVYLRGYREGSPRGPRKESYFEEVVPEKSELVRIGWYDEHTSWDKTTSR